MFIGFTFAFARIILPRFIENNYVLAKYIFCKFFNITAPDSMAYKNLQTPAKTWAQIANPLGLIFGVILGISVAGFVFFARVIINSAQSFFEFSAGFLNLALERKIFNNWRKNENKTNRFGFGFLGLVLSSPFAALGLGIMVLKYVPIICSMVVSAPIVAMWRSIRELIKFKKETHRFGKIDSKNAENKKNFKRLLKYIYGSLGAFGSVPDSLNKEIETIAFRDLEKNDMHKGYRPEWYLQTARFVRKAFTFNTRTIAEKFLAKVLAKVLESESDADTNINDILNTIDETITAEEKGCFFSAVDLIALKESLYKIKSAIIIAYNKAYDDNQENKYKEPKYTTTQYLFFNENENENENASSSASFIS